MKNIFTGPTQKEISVIQENTRESDKRFQKKIKKMIKKLKGNSSVARAT